MNPILTSAESTAEAMFLVTKYSQGSNQLPKANNDDLNELLDTITAEWSEDVPVQTQAVGFLLKLSDICKSIPEREFNDVVTSKFCLFYLATKLEDIDLLAFADAHYNVMLHTKMDSHLNVPVGSLEHPVTNGTVYTNVEK